MVEGITQLLSQQEFCDRFAAEMVRIAGAVFSDGESVEKYACETAPSYFEDQYAEDPNTTPEECASSDISYWEPE